jgi:transposase
MKQMTPAAVERAMKLQEVMLRAMAKRITWYQAAEILGISGRQMLRWQTRFKHEGYEGLFDRRRGGAIAEASVHNTPAKANPLVT